MQPLRKKAVPYAGWALAIVVLIGVTAFVWGLASLGGGTSILQKMLDGTEEPRVLPSREP